MNLAEMRERISAIRERIRYRGEPSTSVIGCVLLVQPVFFPPQKWIRPPSDWPIRTQADKIYELSQGEGARVWAECLDVASKISSAQKVQPEEAIGMPKAARHGTALLVTPRLGQGTLCIAVTESYGNGCAITGEHSLSALEAGHMKPFASGGPHEVSNGLLLRADLHRLFEQGYLTVTPQLILEVSNRLREDYANGRSYYPLHGQLMRRPLRDEDRPTAEFLEWHNNVYLG
ncbi:MAG: HNH endonuclease [Acidobacteriota bacterium]|nr:HNH endonuclease [Acidobacteriota bacterium]